MVSNIGTLLPPLPTSPRPPPSKEGGVNSMLFNFLSPPKVGGEYRGGFSCFDLEQGVIIFKQGGNDLEHR